MYLNRDIQQATSLDRHITDLVGDYYGFPYERVFTSHDLSRSNNSIARLCALMPYQEIGKFEDKELQFNKDAERDMFFQNTRVSELRAQDGVKANILMAQALGDRHYRNLINNYSQTTSYVFTYIITKALTKNKLLEQMQQDRPVDDESPANLIVLPISDAPNIGRKITLSPRNTLCIEYTWAITISLGAGNDTSLITREGHPFYAVVTSTWEVTDEGYKLLRLKTRCHDELSARFIKQCIMGESLLNWKEIFPSDQYHLRRQRRSSADISELYRRKSSVARRTSTQFATTAFAPAVPEQKSPSLPVDHVFIHYTMITFNYPYFVRDVHKYVNNPYQYARLLFDLLNVTTEGISGLEAILKEDLGIFKNSTKGEILFLMFFIIRQNPFAYDELKKLLIQQNAKFNKKNGLELIHQAYCQQRNPWAKRHFFLFLIAILVPELFTEASVMFYNQGFDDKERRKFMADMLTEKFFDDENGLYLILKYNPSELKSILNPAFSVKEGADFEDLYPYSQARLTSAMADLTKIKGISIDAMLASHPDLISLLKVFRGRKY